MPPAFKGIKKDNPFLGLGIPFHVIWHLGVPPAAPPAAGPLPFSLSELLRESAWCDDIVAAGACWGIFWVEAAVSSGVTAEPVVV